jgi:GDP-L-fucose synthase
MDLRKKRILITGGGGFLGQHFIKRLHASACEQVFAPRRSEFDLVREADVCRLVNSYRPEVVVHLAAAVGGIAAHTRNPGAFVYENVMMGCQLMEMCRRGGTEKFLTAGTICAYPKFTKVPFSEEDLWNGYPAEITAPYGLAKKMLIVQSESYFRQYGFCSINVLLANLYGPGDHFEIQNGHVIPALICRFIDACERDEATVTVWGTGKATREFLFVDDAALAIKRAVERLETPAPVNIGSGQEVAIVDLARLIAFKTGFRGTIRFDASMPDGQPRRCVDVSRAKHLLDFQASTSLPEGLDRTISWYRAHRESARLGTNLTGARDPAAQGAS